jgi:hypothetical protein
MLDRRRQMRFIDTERLLPNPDHPNVKGTNGRLFKTQYSESDPDPDTEFGYAYNGVTPLYMASALYAVDRVVKSSVTNMIQPQIAPYINAGITRGSFSSVTSTIPKEVYHGSYFEGWRKDPRNLGTVVPNKVAGYDFHWETNGMVHTVKWISSKESKKRAARFKGAWCIVQGSHKLYNTLCGYYSGIENVPGYREWKIWQGRADDAGLALSRMTGYRASWISGPKTPYQIAAGVWQKVSRVFRAYTGLVAQTLGSSSYFSNIHMFAHGAWEQVYDYNVYLLGLDFSDNLYDTFELKGRGAANFHMIDLLDFRNHEHRLTVEVPGSTGSHPKFLDNLYEIKAVEVTSFNGDKNGGTVTRKIPYVDIEDWKQCSFLAKCKTFVGGIRSVLTKVKYADNTEIMMKDHRRNATFNAGCVETPTPCTTDPVFETLYVIQPEAEKSKPTESEILWSRVAAPPVPRSSLEERIKRTPSVETFPNADVKDDGLMPQITSVIVTNADDSFRLTIRLVDGTERAVGFMPVSVLLVDNRNEVLASHNKVATGNFGYGYLPEDPYSLEYGIKIFSNPAPAYEFTRQERWHVPYKDLIKISWERAVDKLPSDVVSVWGDAEPNPYIYKGISDNNPTNRYTAYDLQIRPPTFLPLFMTAQVCHEGGSTAFAGALARGLIKTLELKVSGTTVTFTQQDPQWVTDSRAYKESIVTLLLLGGIVVDKFVDANGSTTDVEFTDDIPLRGSPSDSFWRLIAEAAGLDSVSDLITHYGVTEGRANIPSSALIAAAGKDPIAFASSMGITVVEMDNGYMIGTRYYPDRASLIAALVEIAAHVITVDTTNVENITTSLGYPKPDEIEPEPKSFAKPFNWLLLLPHATTAAITVASKATQKDHLGK